MKPGYLRKGLVKVTHSIVLPKAATRLWFLLLVLLVTSVACAQSAYVATVKTLDKKPGQQELFQQLSLLEPFTRLPDPSAQRDVAETLEWLKTRTDGKGASAQYSYAHAAWLWAAGRQEDAAKQYLMAEFQAFWDGTRCADPSAAPARTAQYASTLGRSIVPFLLSADQAVRRRVVGELSPNLGEGFGDNPKDDWLCNGGAAYFRKYAEKHPEFGQQRIGDPSFSGQTIVLTDDTIHPEFISDEEWRVKRKEVADAYLKEVNSMLMMEANESKRPQRNTNGASGLGPSQPVSPGPSEASRSQTLEHQWVIKHRLHHEFGVTVLAMSPSGREVAAGSFLDQRVGMWDVERGTLLRQLKEIKGGARALAYSPDGRFFAAGRDAIKPGDLCVFVYQAGTDTIVQRLQSPAMTTRMAPQGIGAVASLQYSPDSRFLAVGFQGGAIGIYETATGQLKKAVSLSSFLQGPVAYSPNGKYLAFGDRSEEMRNALGPHVIQLLDTETG